MQPLDELNAWLVDQCVAYAKRARHPELRDRTVFDVFEEERSRLMPFLGPFAGFAEKPMRATTTCLVTHDRNKYSVDAKAAGRAVLVPRLRRSPGCPARRRGRRRTCAQLQALKRDQVVYDPWHYLPVLLRKPGALRNGAPFKDWDLPAPLSTMRARLQHRADGDRQFVKILSREQDDGVAAVADACAEALEAGVASGDVVIAILARKREPPTPPSIITPDALKLKRRAHRRLRSVRLASQKQGSRLMERHQIIDAMTSLKLYGMRASFDEIAGKGLNRREEL